MLTWAVVFWFRNIASLNVGAALLFLMLSIGGDIAIFFFIFIAVMAKGWPH